MPELSMRERERLAFLAAKGDPDEAINDALSRMQNNMTRAEWAEYADLSERSESRDNGQAAETRSAGGSHSAEDRAFTKYLVTGKAGNELRAAGETGGESGGFTVPQGFWNQLAIALKLYGGASQYFGQCQTDDGRVMPYPTNNPTTTVGSYITENSQVSDTNYVFGQGQLFAWTVTSGVIKCSLQFLQDSATDVDRFVADRIGENIGRKMAAEVITGVGPASKAASGLIPSLSAFGTGNSSGGYFQLGAATSVKMFSGTTTELLANVLAPSTAFQMIEAVDPAYYDNAAFYMNSKQAWNQRQVVDSNGRPLLNLDDGFADGAIGSMGGFPVRVVNEIPNLTASTVEGPVFGDLGRAMVLRTVRGANVLSLSERYADLLQHAWIGYQRFDSQPVDLRAAVTVESNSS